MSDGMEQERMKLTLEDPWAEQAGPRGDSCSLPWPGGLSALFVFPRL